MPTPMSENPAVPIFRGADKVPNDVRDEVTTFEANAVPVSVPAGAMTGVVVAAVAKPLPLSVMTGIAVDEPIAPVLELTVARVRARDPAVFVTSPVCAGSCAACRVPEA